jgi:predicted FMN-binding regulatory protein PaiB
MSILDEGDLERVRRRRRPGGVWKPNQNHPRENRLGVIAGLNAMDDAGASAIAAAMTKQEDGG